MPACSVMSPRLHRRHQSGFTLIEVMVAVIVLAIGLMSIAALQMQGIRFNYDSYNRSQAVMLAQDYAERMFANRPRTGADDDLYAPFDSALDVDCGVPPAICATQSDTAAVQCDDTAMATYDRFVLACGLPIDGGVRYGGVQTVLPNGALTIECLDVDDVVQVTCTPGLRHRITVSWDERTVNDDSRLVAVQRVQFQLVVQP